MPTPVSKNLSILDIRDFGAVGDGSTDDSAAFQAAFNLMFGDPHGRHVLHLANGDYRITQPWLFDESTSPELATSWRNLKIVGSAQHHLDRGTVLRFDVPETEHCIEFRSSYGIVFEDLAIRQVNNNPSSVFLNALQGPLFSGTGAEFRRVNFAPFGGATPSIATVVDNNQKQSVYTGCWFPTGTNKDMVGLQIGRDRAVADPSLQHGVSNIVDVDRCFFFCRLDLTNNSQVNIHDCAFLESTHAAIDATGMKEHALTKIRNNFFAGNNGQAAIPGITLGDTQARGYNLNIETTNRIEITGNHFRDIPLCIDTGGAHGVDIVGNTFNLDDAAYTGIRIHPDSEDVKIWRNNFSQAFFSGATMVDDQRWTSGNYVDELDLVIDDYLTADVTLAASPGETVLLNPRQAEWVGWMYRIEWQIPIEATAAGEFIGEVRQFSNGSVFNAVHRDVIWLDAGERGTLRGSAIVRVDQSLGWDTASDGLNLVVKTRSGAAGTALGSTDNNAFYGVAFVQVTEVPA